MRGHKGTKGEQSTPTTAYGGAAPFKKEQLCTGGGAINPHLTRQSRATRPLQRGQVRAGGLLQDRFDAADAGGGGLLLDDVEVAENARVLDVGPAAHLARKIADGVRFDDFAVF